VVLQSVFVRDRQPIFRHNHKLKFRASSRPRHIVLEESHEDRRPYARVSSAKQQLNENIASQIAAIEEYARKHDYQISPPHIYKDDGYSGARLDRPALDRLRDAVAQGDVEAVLIRIGSLETSLINTSSLKRSSAPAARSSSPITALALHRPSGCCGR
jgi:resolvase-like protein